MNIRAERDGAKRQRVAELRSDFAIGDPVGDVKRGAAVLGQFAEINSRQCALAIGFDHFSGFAFGLFQFQCLGNFRSGLFQVGRFLRFGIFDFDDLKAAWRVDHIANLAFFESEDRRELGRQLTLGQPTEIAAFGGAWIVGFFFC